MKNKKNIYFLAPAVILIWGLLIYKVVSGLNPSVDKISDEIPVGEFVPKSFKQAEAFTISADYRDPFLGTVEKKKTTQRKKAIVAKKPVVPFPSVVYKGIVSPKEKNDQVYLVTINGNSHLFKRNVIFSGVKLLKGNAKEITLQFEKQVQTFQLKK